MCNCLQGIRFPTPFGTPHGVGKSSPLVNFLWGFFNLVIGMSLISNSGLSIGIKVDFIAVLLGAIGAGAYLSMHFGNVRSN